MFSVELDATEYIKHVEALQGRMDQVPYALALALNKANENTRELLVRVWPQHVKARQSGFIRYALRRGPPATKRELRVEIYDQTRKPFIKRLDTGGTHAAKGSNLAIPFERNVRIGAHGVKSAMLPRNLPNAFVADLNGRGPAVWQRQKTKKGTRIKLMYVLKPSVPVPHKLSFSEDFEVSMRNEVRTSFPAAMARAMKGRRS
jgi:hypothetical protein